MSLVPTPATIADSARGVLPLLEAVNKEPGAALNTLHLISTSPRAPKVYLALSGALGEGALAAAEIGGRAYCLSARAYLDKNLAHLSGAATAARRTARRMMRRRIRRYIPPPR